MHPNIPLKPPLARECKLPLKFLWVYIRGTYLFRNFTGKTITIYGSARLNSEHRYYQKTQALATTLSNTGYHIMTGGGPGLMEAANRGAQLGKKHSLGCCMQLPGEKKNNAFLDAYLVCRYFFVRKVLLTRFSCAFIAAPGGYGTLDELFEILTLIRTHQIKNFPVILFGIDYWQPLLDFLRKSPLETGAISEDDLACITLTDNIEDIVSLLEQCYAS